MLRVYNTLGRKKEPFEPVEDDHVRMYVCGMTVYGDAHIGHARTYLAFDIVKRYLEYREYEVTYVQNVTNVDDKIINAARERDIPPLEHSAEYTERCLGDLEALGIRPADVYPKASEHIEDMIALVEDIIEHGHAYEADGDVYFSVESFDDYGKLSGQRVEEMRAGARIQPGDKKRSPLDFTLWKAAKPGEPSWESPWGEGRPGWHIECSTMSTCYLGAPFDIHGGGHDLVFPHHENEIAQAEAGLQEQFARYWLHSGMLNVAGEKMSKSEGNFVTIREALQRWNAETLRFFFASYHYRSPADYSEENMEMARRRLERIHRLRDDLRTAAADADVDEEKLGERDETYLQVIRGYRER
ncbi:MAG: cysteine--tRNA ligase, partial [Thermoplasmatota archaeon]